MCSWFSVRCLLQVYLSRIVWQWDRSSKVLYHKFIFLFFAWMELFYSAHGIESLDFCKSGRMIRLPLDVTGKKLSPTSSLASMKETWFLRRIIVVMAFHIFNSAFLIFHPCLTQVFNPPSRLCRQKTRSGSGSESGNCTPWYCCCGQWEDRFGRDWVPFRLEHSVWARWSRGNLEFRSSICKKIKIKTLKSFKLLVIPIVFYTCRTPDQQQWVLICPLPMKTGLSSLIPGMAPVSFPFTRYFFQFFLPWEFLLRSTSGVFFFSPGGNSFLYTDYGMWELICLRIHLLFLCILMRGGDFQ